MPRLPVTAISMLLYGAFLTLSVAAVVAMLGFAEAPPREGQWSAQWRDDAAATTGIAPAWLRDELKSPRTADGPVRLPR